MGDNPEDLEYLGGLLDRHENLYVDISSRVPELGRQPFTARKFFIRYQDRILFGTDGGYALDENGLWPAKKYFRTYFEFLETTNEYFEYPLWGINKQGRWRVYGIDLPDQVLKKIYHVNAEKILAKRMNK
jgi:predicted TIM-barrel fold metal-dependent hydrolase